MVDKVEENRLRRMAGRQGFVLEKSRRRDRRARDYGMYRLLPDHRDLGAHRRDGPFNRTIQEVEQFLTAEDED